MNLKELEKEWYQIERYLEQLSYRFRSTTSKYLNKKKEEGQVEAVLAWEKVRPEWETLAFPLFMEIFEDAAESKEIASFWEEFQANTYKFNRRNELLKLFASLVPLDLRSPFVTFLLCVQRLGLNKVLRDVVPIIYRFYIICDTSGFDLGFCEALKRILRGERWLLEDRDSVVVEWLKCPDNLCREAVTLNEYYVKSEYFDWLDRHFLRAHKCTWRVFLEKSSLCEHKEYWTRVFGEAKVGIRYMNHCKDCGKILTNLYK